MMIYLDHNSTSPIDPRVVETIHNTHQQGYLNPASQHREGQRARKKLETLRQSISQLLGGETAGMASDTLVFTSGGTESNNLALIGLASHAAKETGTGEIFVSAVEHPSIIGAAEALARNGFSIRKLPVDSNGVVLLDTLQQWVTDRKPLLVSVMLANNETGVIQPIQEISSICRTGDVLFHTDAVQWVGKQPLHFGDLNVDALTFTAHKFQGPRGIGGLLLKHGLTADPILFGGFQQMAVRPGTEDVALVAGMEHALRLAAMDESRASRMCQLRDRLENRLLDLFPDLVINGRSADRLPHTSNLSFPEIDRQAFLMAADMNDLAVSTGSACASGSSEPSPVLLAMKADPDVVRGSIRISLGANTSVEEIDEAILRIGRIVENLSG